MRFDGLKRWLVAVVLLAGCGSSAFARFEPVTCKNAFTIEQEQVEGAKVAAQVYQQMPVLPDSDPVSRYIQRLGVKLVAQAPGYKWQYNFHVVASEDINAFALPGGSIFVNLGTIQAAETEAQLAGVMAHETRTW
ncbi:MAG: peptidase [Acidobacteriaceae bacterium]|nr:peptidase [Acidobacteriaceae bacterium]